MLAALAEMADSGVYTHTLHLTAGSQRDAAQQSGGGALAPGFAALVRQAPESGTGLVIFSGAAGALAVAPPFPVDEDLLAEGTDIAPLVGLLRRDVTVGVVLLRLGRYAVGVLQGDDLLASKSDSRYVKNRHRKGGSSQRRFERSRERLVRELFDKACETAARVFGPYQGRLQYLILGGERHTLLGFEGRCEYLRRSGVEVLPRRLAVERPGKAALEGIHREVGKSRVHELKWRDAEE
jgi:peptide subunit release factor 1 (eRF1)